MPDWPPSLKRPFPGAGTITATSSRTTSTRLPWAAGFAADPEVTSYKLELVASRLGVELDDAHDAAADVTATLDILGVYTSRLRQTEGTATAMQKKEKTRKYFKI